tara:strand:+ start:7279 stop:7539 length:261 start_codon:yes stop_codon:yes gene_type:complete
MHREDSTILGFDRELLAMAKDSRNHTTLHQTFLTRSSRGIYLSSTTIDEIGSIQPDFQDFRPNDVGTEMSAQMFNFWKLWHALFHV